MWYIGVLYKVFFFFFNELAAGFFVANIKFVL